MGDDSDRDRDFADPFPSDNHRDDSPLRAELAPGEAILWRGQPQVGTLVLRSLPISIFGVFFGGFAVFWIGMASSRAGTLGLFGFLPLIVGVGLLLAPVWAAVGAGRTWYAVTDRRVILREPSGLGVTVRSYAPAALSNIVRTQRGDGSGDLIFEEIQTRNHDGHRHITRHGFKAIPDVRRVEALIQSTLLAERP